MPPSCHDLPFLRPFLCERGGDRRSWGILASQFQACEGVSSCAALTPHLSPSLLHRDGFAGCSPRSLDPLLTGLLIRSCSLSAACLPSCVALGLALLRPTDYHGATFAPFSWPRGLSVLLIRGPAGLDYALSRAGRGRAFILVALHALWPCRSALGRPPGRAPPRLLVRV